MGASLVSEGLEEIDMRLTVNMGGEAVGYAVHFHYTTGNLITHRHPEGIQVPTTHCHVHVGDCQRGDGGPCNSPYGARGTTFMSPSEPGFPNMTRADKYVARKHAFTRAVHSFAKDVREQLWMGYLVACPPAKTKQQLRRAG